MSIFSPAIAASLGECTSVVTAIFKSCPMVARISQPLRTSTPRNERTEVRFPLSYDALKIKSTCSAAQTSAIFSAIRQINFSDSITHGPRMNAGRLPPILTLPTRNGLAFTLISKGKQERRKFKGLLPAFLRFLTIFPSQDRKLQTAHTTREKRTARLRAFAEDTAVANQRENLKWKTPRACAEEIHS